MSDPVRHKQHKAGKCANRQPHMHHLLCATFICITSRDPARQQRCDKLASHD
ncbi:hypothetical protein QE443_001695 [Pantoea ananatis]|nr:hypothetical protein [Pantoea ananatis]